MQSKDESGSVSVSDGSGEHFFLAPGYVYYTEVPHFDDTSLTDEWQDEVYRYALKCAQTHGAQRILDIGCGSGYKLMKYFSNFETLGLEMPKTLEFLQTTYPDRRWAAADADEDFFPPADLCICSDVIEHVRDPLALLEKIRKSDIQHMVISTPAREVLFAEGKREYLGPPSNRHHHFEWTLKEFSRLLRSFFDIEEHWLSYLDGNSQLASVVPGDIRLDMRQRRSGYGAPEVAGPSAHVRQQKETSMNVHHIPETISKEFGVTLPLDRLVHVGANTGQEVAGYDMAGITAYHIEAIPEVFKTLQARCSGFESQTAINACCDATPGLSVEFNVTNNLQSSSLLDLGRHAMAYPNVNVVEKIQLETTTIDKLVSDERIPSDLDFLLLDVQGAEKRVLSGATELLKSPTLWGVLVEVSLDPLYEGGSTFDEVYLSCLKPLGFYLKSANFNKHGWTDALFLKRWWRQGDDLSVPLEAFHAPQQGSVTKLQGQCSQSSLSHWSNGDGEANRAINRFPNGGFAFHTAKETNAWWKIEWPENVLIEDVLLYNRIYPTVEVAERIVGAVLEASVDGENWEEIHRIEEVFGGADGMPLRLSLPSVEARFFRVRQPKDEYLHLDSIQFKGRQAWSSASEGTPSENLRC